MVAVLSTVLLSAVSIVTGLVLRSPAQEQQRTFTSGRVSAPTTSSRPAVTARVLLPATLSVPGKPSLAMPAKGQAVIAVLPDDAEAAPRVLASTPRQRPVPIASVAKVMTAYLILRDHPLRPATEGPRMVISAEEAAAYRDQRSQRLSVVKLRAGQKLSERKALEALLIASADNVAHVLARWDAGSSEAFVAKMNAEAKALGMTNTRFTDPSGLDAKTVSTADDLLLLAKAALSSPQLVAIAGIVSAKLPVHGQIDNYNTLLGSKGVFGIKTGSTTAAGGCLMYAARRQLPGGAQVTLVGAVLGQPGNLTTMLTKVTSVTGALLDSAAASGRTWTIVRAGQPVAVVPGVDDPSTATNLVTGADVKLPAWPGMQVRAAVSGLDGVSGSPTLTLTGEGIDISVPLVSAS